MGFSFEISSASSFAATAQGEALCGDPGISLWALVSTAPFESAVGFIGDACVVTMRRQGVMRRRGAMRRQGMCRHNASSGGNVSSGGNASSGNVSSQCVVRGAGDIANVSSQCVVSVSAKCLTQAAGALYIYIYTHTCILYACMYVYIYIYTCILRTYCVCIFMFISLSSGTCAPKGVV